MKAMILAAGTGTRLKPFTDTRPKALLELNGKTLLEHIITRLIPFGYNEYIINIHHFGASIVEFIESKGAFGQRIEFSDESGQLLDTGGGLKKASGFFDDRQAFLLHNVDIISDLDLAELRRQHLLHRSLATLAVRQRETARTFLFDPQMKLCGWKNTRTGETKGAGSGNRNATAYAFSGIQIIDPEIFQQISEQGKFSLTDLYVRLAGNHNIRGFLHNDGFWSDAGKPEALAGIENWLKNEERIRS